MPENIKFFIDPYRVIEKYTSCGFNKTKSKIEAYELGVIWKYANNGTNLSGAHDSLVDAKAQTDILVHGSFVPFIDRSSSIQPIDEFFSRTVQNEWRKELEPIRPVHAPWVELTNEHNIMWEPRWQDKYTGPHGGPKAGPTQFIADIVRSAKDLCDIFLAILPLAFFERVAQLTEKYCYDDWVVAERRKKDSNGNEMKATYFVPVLPLTDGAPTPNRRHRADKERVRYHISAGFIITWIGILANKCTDVRVSLGMVSGSYCRMCYRKQLTTELSAKDRQQRCRTSRMGCLICKEPICKECWKEGYDKHA